MAANHSGKATVPYGLIYTALRVGCGMMYFIVTATSRLVSMRTVRVSGTKTDSCTAMGTSRRLWMPSERNPGIVTENCIVTETSQP